jgi:beta-lactamase regulating signal transducer with metallopeptidase domain
MMFLLSCAVQITIILLIALLSLPLLRKTSAASRHWVLSVAVAFALCVPVLNLVMPSWHLPALMTTRAAIAPLQQRIASAITPPAVAAEPAVVTGPTASNREATVARPTTTPISAVRPGLIWLSGVLAGGFFLLLGLVRLTRIALASSPMTGGAWTGIADRISSEYGLRRRARLLQSPNSSILVTWGVVQPKVILPAGAEEWPEDRAMIVLRHELAHVRRNDWAVQMIAQFLRVIFWFNPLVWVVCWRLRLESECACDDAVVGDDENVIQGHEYAAHLLDLARILNRTDRAWSEALTMARSSTIERRFSAMLNPVLNRRPATRIVMFAAILAGLAITLPLSMVGTAKEVPEQAALTGEPERSSVQNVSGQEFFQVLRTFSQGLTDGTVLRVRPRDRALYEAAEQGDVSEIDDLIRAGANVNVVVPGDGNPLMAAVRRGRLETLVALLDRGADPNVTVRGDGTALIVAAQRGRADMAKTLLDRGADPNLPVVGDGNPLIAAAARGRGDVVSMLLDRGANINASVEGDENALVQASANGHLHLVKFLVSRGADIHARFWIPSYPVPGMGKWRTALSQARERGHQDVVEFLLSIGARD